MEWNLPLCNVLGAGCACEACTPVDSESRIAGNTREWGGGLSCGLIGVWNSGGRGESKGWSELRSIFGSQRALRFEFGSRVWVAAGVTTGHASLLIGAWKKSTAVQKDLRVDRSRWGVCGWLFSARAQGSAAKRKHTAKTTLDCLWRKGWAQCKNPFVEGEPSRSCGLPARHKILGSQRALAVHQKGVLKWPQLFSVNLL